MPVLAIGAEFSSGAGFGATMELVADDVAVDEDGFIRTDPDLIGEDLTATCDLLSYAAVPGQVPTPRGGTRRGTGSPSPDGERGSPVSARRQGGVGPLCARDVGSRRHRAPNQRWTSARSAELGVLRSTRGSSRSRSPPWSSPRRSPGRHCEAPAPHADHQPPAPRRRHGCRSARSHRPSSRSLQSSHPGAKKSLRRATNFSTDSAGWPVILSTVSVTRS